MQDVLRLLAEVGAGDGERGAAFQQASERLDLWMSGKQFAYQSDSLFFPSFHLLLLLATYRVDDGGGASLLHRFAAGVGVQAAGVVSAAAPHAAVLGFGRVAPAAVGAAHRTVVQSHCGRAKGSDGR